MRNLLISQELSGFITCLIMLFYVQRSRAVHSIKGHFIGSQGLYFPEYMEYITVDDVTVFYYDSTMRAEVPLPEWLDNPDGRLHWKAINSIAKLNRQAMVSALQVVTQHINQTRGLSSGVNIYQGHSCCELNPNGSSRSFLAHAYNGKDFLNFDVKLKAWTAVVLEAAVYKTQREKNPAVLEVLANFYQYDCFERLKVFLQHVPTLRIKKEPEVSVFEKRGPTSSEVTCHVTGFYPREVQVEWLGVGGLPLVEGVVSGELLPNGDGSFQLSKILMISHAAQNTESYSCLVRHSSLSGNITRIWVVPRAPDHRIIAGAVVGVVCLLGALVALWWYRSRTGAVL